MNRSEFASCIKNESRTQGRQARRAKGTGTIEKRSNATKPFLVKVPVGTYQSSTGRVQTRYKSLGMFETRRKAQAVLSEYLRTPYDIDGGKLTFADLYERWLVEYVGGLKRTSSSKLIISTYAYCHEYYDIPIRKVTIGIIKDMMANAYIEIVDKNGTHYKKCASNGVKERIKSLCNLMFDYAVEHKYITENPARAFTVTDLLHEIDKEAKRKKPFTKEDVDLLWKNVNNVPFCDMVLIGIYTGFRPQELCLLETKNIDWNLNEIVGGMKTEAGTDRHVPIHPKIKVLMKTRYDQAVELCHSEMLFNTFYNNKWNPITYHAYRHRFENVMTELGLVGYSPHCTRHTFATFAEFSGMRDYATKLILGHSYRTDVTDHYYKHLTSDYLQNEMAKYKIGDN